MPFGPAVRPMFGPYEAQVTELWRSLFIDLDRRVAQVALWC